MAKRWKLLEQMRNNPRDWRMESLLSLAEAVGIEVRNDGGSHHVFSWPGLPQNLCVPAARPIKPLYVRRFVDLVDAVQEVRNARQDDQA